MELYFKYVEAVQQADKRIEGEKHVRAIFLSSLLTDLVFLLTFDVFMLNLLKWRIHKISLLRRLKEKNKPVISSMKTI